MSSLHLAESKATTTDPESVLARLQASSAESEEKSEKIVEDFLESSLSTDEFLEQFKASRMEMHLRKLKVEKMQELLRRGAHQGAPPQHGGGGGGGAGNFSSGFYQNAPYPSMMPGGFPMPMMPPPPHMRPSY
jgi:ESCRT-I complex subunit VPS37